MRRRLIDGEQVLISCRPHSRVLLWPLAVGLVLIILTAAALGRLQESQYYSWAPNLPSLRQPAIVLLLTAVILIEVSYPIRRLLSWAATRYVLTSHRLVIRKGNLGRRTTDYYFIQTESLHLKQKLRQRMVGSGDIQVQMASGALHTISEVPFVAEFLAEAQSAWQLALRGSLQQAPGLAYYAGEADFLTTGAVETGFGTANGKELRKFGRDS